MTKDTDKNTIRAYDRRNMRQLPEHVETQIKSILDSFTKLQETLHTLKIDISDRYRILTDIAGQVRFEMIWLYDNDNPEDEDE